MRKLLLFGGLFLGSCAFPARDLTCYSTDGHEIYKRRNVAVTISGDNSYTVELPSGEFERVSGTCVMAPRRTEGK